MLTWYKIGGIKDKITANLFIKNLHEDIKTKDLYDHFISFGKISSCKVKYRNSGKCKGYGYVQFEVKESAEKALSSANGSALKGLKIEVSPYKPPKERNSSIAKYNNLFVKCIPKKYTNENLKELFSEHGEIISAVVIKDRTEDIENKGFGFVCFKSADDARKAEEKKNQYKIEGQELFVVKALSKEEHAKKKREDRLRTFKDCNLYVKELPDDTDDEKLKKAFTEFGTVVSVRVMLEKRQDDHTGKILHKTKNFGFVCFTKKEDAKKAIELSRTKEILGRNLYVNIAEKKEERAARAHRGGFFPYPPFPMGWGMGMNMYNYNMPPPPPPPPQAFYQNQYPRPHRPRQVKPLSNLFYYY